MTKMKLFESACRPLVRENDPEVRREAIKQIVKIVAERPGQATVTIMEVKAILSGLKPDELIHHIDWDRTNDSIENLYVCNRHEHALLHKEMKTIFSQLCNDGIIAFDHGHYLITTGRQK